MAKQAQKRTKHIPQRTCIGCRLTLPKKALIRIVRSSEGVKVDLTGKAPGRGAYIHGVRSCWEKALAGPVVNALKTDLTNEDRQGLLDFAATLPDEPLNDSPAPEQNSATGRQK